MAYNIEANKRGLFAVLFDECYRAFFMRELIFYKYDRIQKI